MLPTEEHCRTRNKVFSILSRRGRPTKDHFRGGGFALGVLDQALSRMELNFHGPCFRILALLHMHGCCMRPCSVPSASPAVSASGERSC